MAMEDSQKIAALKTAYADVILNTAKEAAARVILSESKAVRIQQDLCCTKDESLRMLVRLKQMIDAKTIEAQMTSLTQQRKIDELEAQLHEAEDIITDLRSELEWLRDKLKKPNNQVQPLDPQTQAIPNPPSDLGLEAVLTSDIKSTPLNETNCYKTKEVTGQVIASDFFNCSVPKSVLPSIFVRSKESELYRNGCTQRIRALEMNLLDGKLLEDVNGQLLSRKHEPVIEMCGKDDRKCSVVLPKNKKMNFMKKFCRREAIQTVMSHTLRRRKTRYGKTKVTSCRVCPVMPFQTYSSSKDEGSLVLSLTEAGMGDNGKTCGDFVSAESDKNQLEAAVTDTKMKSLPCLKSGLSIIKSNVDLKSGSNRLNLKTLNRCSLLLNAASTYTEPRHESIVENREAEATENPNVPCLSSKVVNEPTACSDLNNLKALEEGDTSPCKSDSDKLLKYTFQRKRKKESSIHPDYSTSPEKQVAAAEKERSEDESSRCHKRAAGIVRSLLNLEINRKAKGDHCL